MSFGSRSVRAWHLALGGLVLSIFAGMLVPIYTDETGWRFQERAAFDGVDSLFSDLCGPHTLAAAPWFMMPVRWFSALANSNLADPFFIRAEGVLCALIWLGLLFLVIRQLDKAKAAIRADLRSLCFALLGLGVLPFLLVLSRPEQPIIITMTLILLVTFAKDRLAHHRYMAWLKVIAIVALSVIALSYHLKGVLYVPVAVACLAVCARGKATIPPRLVGIAVLGAFAAASAHYWTDRLRCSDDPILAAMYARENIAAIFAGQGNVWAKLSQIVGGANPLNYVVLAAPDSTPMSNWIPAGMFSPEISFLFAAVLSLLWATVLLFALWTLLCFLAAERSRAIAERRVPIAIMILGVTLVWGASQLNKNVYEASHILPMLILFVLLCLTLPGTSNRIRRALAITSRVALPLAFISQIIVLGVTIGPLMAKARTPGYVDAQPFSVSIAGYSGVRRDIETAMVASGMPTDRRLNRLLIDELTYLALQESYLPIHRLGVLSVWNGSIADPVAYLRSRGSDGVVLGCRFLPTNMRTIAARSGEICAISRQGLDKLAAIKTASDIADPFAQNAR